MTKKEEFIEHMSAMNTKSLEAVLVKNAFKKYANVSFIEKLNDMFTEFKISGNTYLEVHKGIGVCTCNKGEKVLCFVGNKTNDYFTLSYQEDEINYYSFSRSCSEVLYNNPPELNNFHYFTINPKETTEYKHYNELSNPIHEFKLISSECVCSMEVIELWLENHKNLHNDTIKLLEDKRESLKLDSVELLINKEFKVLYGKLDILSRLYKKEAYFKQQLEDYNDFKDSVSKLKNWFEYQAENRNEYQLFSSVFYDNREHTHYCLKLDDLALNPKDFKHTLKYLSIIESSKAIEFVGTVIRIQDLETFDKTKSRREFTKRNLILSIDDFVCSEYQVSFTNGRIIELDNISEGDLVKVSARLTGGEGESAEGFKEHKHKLFGWRIEKLEPSLKSIKNTEDMDLYYKFILPPPF
ncbi:MAG TPA: DUF3127 domain-containing protein [Edaphocola sp.]|nr:DUF3127 domain-containing protein [Edaphocola sp.]